MLHFYVVAIIADIVTNNVCLLITMHDKKARIQPG